MASWRDRARVVVAETIAAHAGEDEKAIRKALFDAYPFGVRQYTPYKVWLDEIKRAMLKHGYEKPREYGPLFACGMQPH